MLRPTQGQLCQHSQYPVPFACFNRMAQQGQLPYRDHHLYPLLYELRAEHWMSSILTHYSNEAPICPEGLAQPKP